MKYKHYPLKLAEKEFKEGQKKRYRITTINWTIAGQDIKRGIDRSKVHKNEHIWTLRYLIKWIQNLRGEINGESYEIWEDIIKIEPIDS